MGLLGFTVYSTNKRMKEISVRKVLGASIVQIVQLFTLEFLALILVAFIIAVPITYLFVHEWLNNFSYRINMSWWIFALGGIISTLLALITITFQTVRASVSNPSKFLKAD
jgi:ABC-type antimicrobial peptide transport system permease subunit